ncbi:MAG TPA: carboxypeptidase regulatory-like domain-containing protein [Candidatus Acidoferrum sp.]|nr:carboxypeptidase regulatory-like domain-containing protein [Candidatus Acidoferrum sp.]
MNKKFLQFLRTSCLAVILILLIAFGFAARASAQAISGDIVGTVVDKTGAAVPAAGVEVTDVATGVKTQTTSNDVGEFRLGNLPVGTYTIRVSKANFTTTTITNFAVELNKTNSINVTLEVGAASMTVEVSGATPLINTSNAQIDNTFDTKITTDLPMAAQGLGVLNLSLLQSGVSTSGGVGAGTGPSVGGQRPRDNNFTIEGVDNNNKSVTGPLVIVPNDAVQEFSALTNQFSPEFGHSNAGQFNTVVKTGTNDIHGKAFGYFQNRNFDAVDQAIIQALGTGAQNPRFDDNRYGGQLGGPVIKNKLFYFGDFEYRTLGRASVAAGGLCAPTADGYAAIQSVGSSISSTNLGILQKYAGTAPTAHNCDNTVATDLSQPPDPVTGKRPPNTNHYIFITNPSSPTQGVTAVNAGLIPVQAPNFTNFKYLTTALDYNISSRDQLRGRYIYNSAVGIDNAAALPAFFLSAPTKFHLASLTEYHTFNPSISNEFRVAFNRFDNVTPAGNFSYPGLDSFPNLIFFDLGLQIGPDSNAPQFTIQNLYQAIDNVTWSKGSHTFKLGMEARKFISPQSFTQRARGDYDYNTVDFFLRDVNPDNLAERSLGNPVYYGDQVGVFWYASDSWRIRQNVTLNLGLRHEYTTIPFGERAQKLNIAASVPGLVDFSEPRAPKTNFMPRVGLAWSPGTGGNTSIRAGFGMGYDVLYDNIGILSLPPQLSGTIDESQSTVIINNFLANGGILPGSGGIRTFPTVAAQQAATANHVVVDQKDPYSIQYDLSVQHRFGSKYSVEARYLGTRGVHLNTQERVNVQSRVDSTHFLPTYLTAPTQATLDALPNTLASISARPNILPAYAANNFTNNLVQFTPNGWSNYNGLALQGSRQFSNGLQFLAAYTWSHTIDNSTADFFSTVITPRRPQDFQNINGDKSSSALDHRHRFSIAAYYDMPYFKNGNWIRKNLMGNWLFAPIYTFQIGEPADVQSGVDANLNGDSAGDRSIFNPQGVPGTGSGVTALCNSSLPAGTACASSPANIVAYLANSPNAQYITVGKGAIATSGRNTLQTRPIDNLDLTAGKRFSLTERTRLEFQAQFLNVLNHPQFTPGLLNQVDSVGFTSAAATNYLKPSNAIFNQPDLAFASNSRTLQMALKLIF